MLPIREILERHGVAIGFEEIPERYRLLFAPAAHSGVRSLVFKPVDASSCWVVEQEKPAAVENFMADYLALFSPAELAVIYEENGRARALTIAPLSVRLLGVGVRQVTRPNVKRVMDE